MEGRPEDPIWSPDLKTLYVTVWQNDRSAPGVWKENVDGSNPEKIVDNCTFVSDIDPSGKYLLGVVWSGEKSGIYEVSVADKKCSLLVPDVVSFSASFARDGKSFLYAMASRGEVTIYRQGWKEGKLIGTSQPALRPFHDCLRASRRPRRCLSSEPKVTPTLSRQWPGLPATPRLNRIKAV